MTNPTPLSPAAQAVLMACNEAVERLPLTARPEQFSIALIAAALRAAADQVVPDTKIADTDEWIGQNAWSQCQYSIRFKLLAIAAELEA